MKVCIVDYGMGNITSVKNALLHLGYQVDLISDPNEVCQYDNIILPGVGAFAKAMEVLKYKKLDISIYNAVDEGKKLIGICLGMQLLLTRSYEFGETEGLNLISGEVLPFKKNTSLRVPHMGWNEAKTNNPDFADLNGDYYFVHSFYCSLVNKSDELFRTKYGIKYCSGLQKDNQIFGFQFHPEKSQKLGLSLLNKVLKDA